MKTLLRCALALSLLSSSHANVLVHESFADATHGVTINGYQSTTSGFSTGLSGAWSLQQGSAQNITRNTAASWNMAQTTNGYPVDMEGGNYHYWVGTGTYTVQRAQTALSSPIDMSQDGTWYLSFFFRSGVTDYALQAGLNDGTTELMVGQGYSADGTSQGVDAWYQAVGGTAIGTSNINPPFATWTAQFMVAKLVKTDSGNTDTLTVSLKSYNLGATSLIDLGDPASWLYSETILGVNNVFTNLQLKNAAGAGAFAALDEIRIGETWADVTGVDTGLAAPAVVTEPPAFTNGVVGGSVNISAVVSGNPVPDFQWQISTDTGANWTDIPGETSDTLTLSGLTYSMNGNWYRLFASNTEGDANSLETELTVTYPAPQITMQPLSIGTNVGTAASFTVVADGVDEINYPLEYQWQRTSDLGENWVDLPGETTTALSFAAVTPSDSDLYRVIVTDPAATQDALPATVTTSSSAYLSVTAPGLTFAYDENGTMVYDGAGVDSAINPHQVFDDDINMGFGLGNTGTLDVNSGTLTLNCWSPWSIKIGQTSGTANINVNGGTLNIRDAGGDNEARVIIGNGNSNGTLTLNGGDVNVSIGPDNDGERAFFICRGPVSGSGTIDLQSGTLTYGSDAPVRVGTYIGGFDHPGVGQIKVGNGSMVISGTSSVLFGATDFIDFTIGGTGSISILFWDSLENVVHAEGYDSFKALIDAGNVRINGQVVAAGDYSPFIFTDDGVQGVMKIDPSYAPAGYTTWAATNAGGQTADQDSDLDGLSNGVEYFMNAPAGFTVNPGVVAGTVTWPNGGNIPFGEYGVQFKVQTSPDLVDWSTDVLETDPNLDNTEGSVSYTLPAGEPKIFVRLMVTPN